MMVDHSKKSQFTRRGFMKIMAGASLASAGTAIVPILSSAKAVPKRYIPMPKFKVTASTMSASKIYQCKTDLKRFSSENVAFKVISEELGISFAEAMKSSMIKNVKQGKIGHKWPVENVIEARIFYALNVAATTWNDFIGPYGENRENKGFLGWLPKNLPPELSGTPLPLNNITEITNNIKVMAAYAGADKTGIARIDRNWVFGSTCTNGLDPGPAKIKKIVFKKTDQPLETEKEFIIPDSVKYAVVIISVQPRALSQIGPSSIAAAVSTNQGYSQGGLSAVALAQAIRSLGYVAIPCMNSTALSIPLAIDAGLGELGRLGQLITPEWGPHVRIDKVLTNLPLKPDKPITFGVTEYCEECGICAQECPSGAISPDKKRSFNPPPSAGRGGNPGALKWYIDGKKCSRWWIESGAPCSNCMNVCPYTQATLGDGFNGKAPGPKAFWELEASAYGRRSITY
jgi:reductive dehalogenase